MKCADLPLFTISVFAMKILISKQTICAIEMLVGGGKPLTLLLVSVREYLLILESLCDYFVVVFTQ